MRVASFRMCWTSPGLLAATAAALPPILVMCSDGEGMNTEGEVVLQCRGDDAKLRSDVGIVIAILVNDDDDEEEGVLSLLSCCRGTVSSSLATVVSRLCKGKHR